MAISADASFSAQRFKADARDLDIMLGGVEAGAYAADDLSVDHDRKTALHLEKVTRGNSRGPAVIDGILQSLRRLLEERRRSGLPRREFNAGQIGSIVHPQYEDWPSAIIDNGNYTRQMIVLRFRLSRSNHFLSGRESKHLFLSELRTSLAAATRGRDESKSDSDCRQSAH
jgi:hypothetical protein